MLLGLTDATAASSALVQPGALRLLPNTVSLWGPLPFVLLVVFVIFALIGLVSILSGEEGVVFGVALLLGFGLAAWLVPFVLLTPNHKVSRPLHQIAVQAGSAGIVWVPAHRLPDGVWWPSGARPTSH